MLGKLIARYREADARLSEAIAKDEDVALVRMADGQLMEAKNAVLQYEAISEAELRLQFEFVLQSAFTTDFTSKSDIQILSTLFDKALTFDAQRK